jgi:intracellular septation protein
VFFRFPGLMILTLVFSFAQAPFLMKYLKVETPPPPPPE